MKSKIITILVVTDNQGNEQDPNGKPYGWYFKHEKDLCERYCKNHNLSYRPKKVEFFRGENND